MFANSAIVVFGALRGNIYMTNEKSFLDLKDIADTFFDLNHNHMRSVFDYNL